MHPSITVRKHAPGHSQEVKYNYYYFAKTQLSLFLGHCFAI